MNYLMNTVERNNRQHELYRTSKRSAEKSGKDCQRTGSSICRNRTSAACIYAGIYRCGGTDIVSEWCRRSKLYKIVDELISPVGEVTFQEKPKRSPRLEYTLEESKEEAIRFQSEAIGTEHMLLAILREPDSVATRILLTLNVNIQKIMQDTLEVLGVDIKEYQEELQEAYQRKDGILDQYGTDLTMQAEEGL